MNSNLRHYSHPWKALLFFASFGLSHWCMAQEMKWESEELKFTPSPADKKVVAHFKFKNVGPEEVKISSVKTSCSCTNAVASQKNIAPGESAEITVTFTFGNRAGSQEKIILVQSNDLRRPNTVLKMKVNIPKTTDGAQGPSTGN